MRTFRNLPGAAVAVGAFVLTVMLGLGGTAASALWQQSATATMTVTAAGSWAGPAFTLSCADPSKKTVELTVAPSTTLSSNQLPATLSVSAVNSSATYSDWQITAPNTSGKISLTTGHPLVSSQSTGLIDIEVTVTYKDNSSASVLRSIHKGNGNSEITCS